MKKLIITFVSFCIISLLGACSPSENENRPNPIIIPYAQSTTPLPPIPRTLYVQALATNITQVIISSGYSVGNYYTFEHEGHLYVANSGAGYFIHSPACLCLNPVNFEKGE